MQPLETTYDVANLNFNNPNHLKQFLRIHPLGLENYDLKSLQHLFKVNKLNLLLLRYIEIRGVVPNEETLRQRTNQN